MLTAYFASVLRMLRLGCAGLCTALCALALPGWAQSSESPELAVLPKMVEVNNQSLQRNGAGIRYKAIFKVYSAALYLEKPATSLEEIGKMAGAKRITVNMLRTINASELGKLFAHGMEDNMDKQQFSKLIPGVMRMSEVFNRHKELKPGDKFTLDWLPGKGMVISVNGTPEPAQFNEPEFYQAMLGIWLGPKPADAKLKQALLAATPD
ncbi:MAG: chalcone isomerase family protein [Comamonas sp.]|nr:chalcone isomerase family protein [uncultured Comamonas sp.]